MKKSATDNGKKTGNRAKQRGNGKVGAQKKVGVKGSGKSKKHQPQIAGAVKLREKNGSIEQQRFDLEAERVRAQIERKNEKHAQRTKQEETNRRDTSLERRFRLGMDVFGGAVTLALISITAVFGMKISSPVDPLMIIKPVVTGVAGALAALLTFQRQLWKAVSGALKGKDDEDDQEDD